MITINGTMERDGDCESIELMTRGNFVKRGGKYFITYNDTDTTGYDGCVTTVKLENDSRVSMLRFGRTASELVIEKGRRHVCHYDTGYGAISLGVSADEIRSSLNENGGTLVFSYALDVNAESISRNEVKITVKPRN